MTRSGRGAAGGCSLQPKGGPRHDAPASLCRQHLRHAGTLARDRRVAAFGLRCSAGHGADRASAASPTARGDQVRAIQSGGNEWTDYEPIESLAANHFDSSGEDVARAALGADELSGLRFDLPAKAPDLHIDRAIVDLVVVQA